MSNFIRNSKITVVSKAQGAELCSIKTNDDELEYLWQADPAIWGRHAPVLFPIVGKLKGNKTIIEGQEYTMGQHGFARDMEFSVVESKSDAVTYLVEANDETKVKYPYNFRLYISYKLIDDSVKVSYVVENLDSKAMFFSIGAHPGFNCPLLPEERFEDYYLEFDKPELINSYRLRDGLIEEGKKLLFQERKSILDVNGDLFREDAIMLENMESISLALKSKVSGRGVEVSYEGFPFLGIWSKPEGGAPFVCIEPWFGLADTVDSNGIYADKKGVVELEAAKSFSASFTIRVF